MPVDVDQAPTIKRADEIVRRLNRQVGHMLMPEARAPISESGRLPGVAGRAKMSKSQGNALALSVTKDTIIAAVRRMYTDPDHLRVTGPGRVEGNVVFTYLDAFDPDRDAVAALKADSCCGDLGDTAVKRRLATLLLDLLAPIRSRRATWPDRRTTSATSFGMTGWHTGHPRIAAVGPQRSEERDEQLCALGSQLLDPVEVLPDPLRESTEQRSL